MTIGQSTFFLRFVRRTGKEEEEEDKHLISINDILSTINQPIESRQNPSIVSSLMLFLLI